MKLDLIVVGRLKKGPLYDLCNDYQNRIQWPLNIIECESKHNDAAKAQNDEQKLIDSHIKDSAFVAVLDERGKALRSMDFAHKIQDLQNAGTPQMQFVIGGADGHQKALRARANLLLSFGSQTWPHMLARVMILEQIYRAQQILKNHPYHRE